MAHEGELFAVCASNRETLTTFMEASRQPQQSVCSILKLVSSMKTGMVYSGSHDGVDGYCVDGES
jgi:hypothetical protein